ncbi:MAG: sugar phosphate isomerase/epimerase [Pseudomonadota bacterium]
MRIGLNPYGLAYTLGLQGHGTDRQNPNGIGLSGYLEIAQEIGSDLVELHEPWLAAMSDDELAAFRARLEGMGMLPVVATGLHSTPVERVLRGATGVGALTVRMVLSTVLCGERGAMGGDWEKLVDEVRTKLMSAAALARDVGVTLAIENHQDFGSLELVEMCEAAGGGVGICYDTGNSFPVAEAPLAFTRRIAPWVRHFHLKDYRVQMTDEGYRLVRVAAGEGAVPFEEIIPMVREANPEVTASIEVAALDARHVRLLTPEWRQGYAPISGQDLAACFAATRRNRLAEDEDYRTPWETGEDDKLAAFELDQVRRSAANFKRMGLMKETQS